MKGPKYLLPLSTGLGLAAGGSYLYSKFRFQGQQYTGEERIPGHTVIVTGASSGVGRAAAIELARRGGRVILACRDTAKGEEVRQEIADETFNKNVVVKQLDLASLKSITKFAQDIVHNEDRVNILVNNAAVMMCPKTLTEDGFEQQLGVNHLGHFLLTNLLAEKLRQSAPSRVVNVTCASHVRGQINFADLNGHKAYSPAGAYAQSKLANVLFTRELATRWQGTGVTAYAVDPGTTRTEIGRHMVAYGLVLAVLSPFTKIPKAGAQTVLYCAVNNEIAGQSGKYYSDCKEVPVEGDNISNDVASRLWHTSAKWTRLHDKSNSGIISGVQEQ